MFIPAVYVTTPNWKQHKCSTDEWIYKLWCFYTMECYTAIKRNKLFIYGITGINFKIVILSERSQTI